MSAPLSIAVADDEPLARKRILRLLAKDHSVQVVASCENAADLMRALRAHRIDAVFLDIEMPGQDGFSALSNLPTPRPRVVFVTAYPHYATRAFDIDATDYLVKPVSEERLLAAVARIRRNLATTNSAACADAPAYPQRVRLTIGKRIRLIDTDTIDHVLVHANYLEIRASAGNFVLRRPIAWMEAQLDPKRFLRLHRSHIVRIDGVARIETMPCCRYRFVLRNGEQLVSGRTYRDRVRRALGLV
jgi:two-component system, LytTR family, response regulator